MYTLAMQGCVVTSTGFEKEAKTTIQKRVEMMGGIYANAFTDQVTHLVARVVRSAKYDVALKKETPIMTEEWVDKVSEWFKDRTFRKFDISLIISQAITISTCFSLGLGKEQARERAGVRRAVRQVQVPLPAEPDHRRLAAQPEG